MSERHPADDEDICAAFAAHPDSEGCTESEFRESLERLLAQGIVRRVRYTTSDGDIRYRIERADTAVRCGAVGCK